jgi:D-alanyl-D-alanine dipeptidase
MALLLCIPLLGINTPKTKNVHKTFSTVANLSNNDDKFLLAGLVDLEKMNADFDFDIRYATTNNFIGTKMYSDLVVF